MWFTVEKHPVSADGDLNFQTKTECLDKIGKNWDQIKRGQVQLDDDYMVYIIEIQKQKP